jgi:subtilase family serine protease
MLTERHSPMEAGWPWLLKAAPVGILLLALAGEALGQDRLGAPPMDREALSWIHIIHAATKTPTGYTPDQIRQAYGFDQLASAPGVTNSTGTGQTIAIVDPSDSPTIQADLQTFCTTFGLPYNGPDSPSPTLQIAYPQGIPRTKAGSAVEITLDVEWAHAIAPGATILLVVAQSSRVSDLLAAVSYAASQGAAQVSMSWGGPEAAGETTDDMGVSTPWLTPWPSSMIS